MKCFYHPDREAVAVCSRCGKPLCKECAKEYKGKIYCKDCLEEIKKEEALEKKLKDEILKKAQNDNPKDNAGTIHKSSTPTEIILTAILISLGIIIALLVSLLFTSRITPAHTKSVVNNTISAPYNGEQILHLQINVDGADIEIIKGEESNKLYEIEVENIHPTADYNSTSSTLEIESNNINHVNNNRAIKVSISPSVPVVSFSIKNKAGDIEISGFNSSYANVAIGAGEIYLNNITSDRLKAVIGTGNITIENCTIKGDSSIANGAGNISLNNIDAKGETNVKLGTGDFIINGAKCLKSLSVKQGIGDCEIDLSNENEPLKENWDINIKNTTGDITLKTDNLPVRAQVRALSVGGNFSKNGDTYNAGDLSSPNIVNISIVSIGDVKLIRR